MADARNGRSRSPKRGAAPPGAYVGRFDGSEARHASPAMAAAAGTGAATADLASLPTSVKWSVLSSRVEGLVAELSQVVGKQDAYCVAQSNAEGPAMRAVREKMLATPWAEEWAKKRTMFSYGEEMSTDPLEAMLLKELAFMARPRRVLEIGMFVGYGAVAMLEGAPAARVVSLEIDPYLRGWIGSCLADARLPEVARRHEVVVGPALDSLAELTGDFDMVFVDANKAEYRRYVEVILERGLLSASGVILCDNVLYNGYPYVDSHFDAQPARRNFGNAIREFNQWVRDHPQLEQVVLPVRDGISIVRRRSPVTGRSVPGVREYHTFPIAPNAMIVDIFMREKGVDYAEIQKIERFVDVDAIANRSEANLKMNPAGGVPWFVLDDGVVIAETIAMCEYIEEVAPGPPLIGRDARQRGVVRQWQRRMEEHYCYPAFYGHRFWTASDDCPDYHFMKGFFAGRLNAHHGANLVPHAWKELCAWAKSRMQWLERVKQEEAAGQGGASDFIAGPDFSVVDIQVYVTLWFFAEAFPHPPQRILEELRGQVPWVQAWFDRVHARPACVAAREYREQTLRGRPTWPATSPVTESE